MAIAGGGIGVVTQSGAMASTLRLGAAGEGASASPASVSTGNEADLTTEDFLGYLIDDEATRVIVLFIEQMRDPQLLPRACGERARAAEKPIVLMHPGRSARAQASARTHTGAMTGDHAVMAALVRARRSCASRRWKN